MFVITGGQRPYGASDFARAKVLKDHGYHSIVVVLHDLDVAVWSQDKAPEWTVSPVITKGGFTWPTCIPLIGPMWTGERKGNPLMMGPFSKLTHGGPKCASALVLRGPSDVLIRDLPQHAVEIFLDAWSGYVPLLQRLEETVGEPLFALPRWETSAINEMINEISQNWRIPWTSFSSLSVEWGNFYKSYPQLYWEINSQGRMEAQSLKGTLFPKRDMLIPEILSSGVSIATSTTLPYKDSVLQLIQKLEKQGLLDRGNVGRWLGVKIRWTKAHLIAERLVQWYGKLLPQDEVEKWASFWETHPPAYVRPEDVEGEVIVMY
jgi:hypothetical protein